MDDQLTRLLVIEDSVLLSLSQRSDVIAAFPFLQNIRPEAQPRKKGGCGRCGAKKPKGDVQLYNSAKLQLASLVDGDRIKLKSLLRAKQVRLTYRDNGGRVITLTY